MRKRNYLNRLEWRYNFYYESHKVLEKSNLYLDEVTKTVKYETKNQDGGFIGVLIAPLAPAVLRSMLTERGVVKVGGGAAIAETR